MLPDVSLVLQKGALTSAESKGLSAKMKIDVDITCSFDNIE